MGGENSGLIIFLKKKGFYLSWTITHIKYFQCVWDFLCTLLSFLLSFPGGASGKEPACQCRRHETSVSSLGGEDPLEEGMATHFSILAWRIPRTEEPGGLQSMGLLGQLKQLSTHSKFSLRQGMTKRKKNASNGMDKKVHQMKWKSPQCPFTCASDTHAVFWSSLKYIQVQIQDTVMITSLLTHDV